VTQHNLAVVIHGIDMDLNITEELAASVPVKGSTTGADLFEEVKKALQSLDIPVQKLLDW
jgi:hypothetical protein